MPRRWSVSQRRGLSRPSATADGGQQRRRCGLVEYKPVVSPCVAGVNDRIRQPAGGAHNRWRAVTQAVYLVQAAGFEVR